jgi:hypothetical protein
MDYEEKDLRKLCKDAEATEEVLLADIMKYKTFIKEFKEEDFDDVIFYQKNRTEIIEKILKHNAE